MKKNFYFFFFAAIVFLNFSCNPDITPAYLILTEKDFKDCISTENFNNVHETTYDDEELVAIRQQNFRDVLVSINGHELGYYQLPCTIPLLPDYSTKNHIRVYPCARYTVTSLTLTPYYFITPVEQFIEMEKEGEYKLSDFKLEYVESVTFPILETFSQTTLFKPFDTIFPTPMEIIYDSNLKKNIGRIALEDTVSYFNVVSSYFYLKGRNARHFLEMYYKCDSGEMITYLDYQGSGSGVPHQDLVIYPATTSWKKAYFDISEPITWAAGIQDRVYVRLGIRLISKDKNAKNAYFYFDNIKIISMYAPY